MNCAAFTVRHPRPASPSPGASAQAAYRRRRQLEREAWRPTWVRRAGAACAAAVTTGVLIGVSMGAWLGWRIALLVAVLMGWRLRSRPSAMARVWRRQAAVQRHTAGMLVVLEHEGYLVLHDITVPGWPAHWSAQGIPVATPRRLADVVRRGSRVQSRAAPVLAITRRG